MTEKRVARCDICNEAVSELDGSCPLDHCEDCRAFCVACVDTGGGRR